MAVATSPVAVPAAAVPAPRVPVHDTLPAGPRPAARRRTHVARGAAPSRVAGTLIAVAGAGLLWAVLPQSLGGQIASVKVDGQSMEPRLSPGDLVTLRRADSYRLGDVVSYRVPKGEFGEGAQVIHRIRGGDGTSGFVMQGDNRRLPDDWHPRNGDIVGKAMFHVPAAGTAMEWLARPLHLAALCSALTVSMTLLPEPERRGRHVGGVARTAAPAAPRRAPARSGGRHLAPRPA